MRDAMEATTRSTGMNEKIEAAPSGPGSGLRGRWMVYDWHSWAEGDRDDARLFSPSDDDDHSGARLFATRDDAEQAWGALVRSVALKWRERPFETYLRADAESIDDVLRRAELMSPEPEPHPEYPGMRRFSEEVSLWVARQFVRIKEFDRTMRLRGIDDLSDSCEVEITLRAADLPRFAPFVITEPGDIWIVDAGTPGLVTVTSEDAEYGWHEQMGAAAKAGIPFHGHHKAGFDYSASGFVSLGGEMIDAWTTDYGDLIVTVDEDLQPEIHESMRAYVAKLKAVRRLFGEER